jgi:2,3-bisphosphoglycerate-independent phosphoglycerate mutase
MQSDGGVDALRVLLVFVDGLGLGADDLSVNPLLRAPMPTLRSLLGGRDLSAAAVPYAAEGLRVVPTDPLLDVPGLPQSATGQTAIFTGEHAARAIGRHLNAYPTPSLKAILERSSIFRRVVERSLRATFLNAFSPQFFDWIAAGAPLLRDRRFRPSASTVAAMAGGLGLFRTLDQLREGDAVSFDLDHAVLRERGFDLEPIDPEQAGRRAARIAGEHHFALYEFFLTDKAGHAVQMSGAVDVLTKLDRFLAGLLEALPRDVTLMLTSDHGNVEDLSVRTHTRNLVPTLLKGPGAEQMAPRIHSLTDITPAILAYLAEG